MQPRELRFGLTPSSCSKTSHSESGSSSADYKRSSQPPKPCKNIAQTYLPPLLLSQQSWWNPPEFPIQSHFTEFQSLLPMWVWPVTPFQMVSHVCEPACSAKSPLLHPLPFHLFLPDISSGVLLLRATLYLLTTTSCTKRGLQSSAVFEKANSV